ncbi:MAG: DUF1592 domain-containing protein [Bdellovibrionales bacterium]
MRRLSRTELINQYKAVLASTEFNLISTDLNGLPEDLINGSVATYEPRFAELDLKIIQDVAYKVSVHIERNFSRISNYGGSCLLTGATTACIQSFLQSASLRFTHYPLSSEMQTKLLALYKRGASSAEGSALVLAYLMSSPEFLYHVEDIKDAQSSDPYDMARKLSYGLAASPPDDELKSLAQKNTLLDDANIQNQADRLLHTPQGRKKVIQFVRYWLELKEVDQDQFSTAFKEDLNLQTYFSLASTELDKFIEYIVFTQKGGFEDLLTSRVSFASGQLATVYGHPGVDGSTMPSGATTNSERLGILLRTPFLQYGDDQTHPILRGSVVLRQVLCDTLGEPDPDALSKAPNVSTIELMETMSTRERTALLTSDSACMACHTRINPVGFALEAFDSLGRFRQSEKVFHPENDSLLASHPVDTSVTHEGITEDSKEDMTRTAAEFVQTLASGTKAPACFTRQAFRFYHLRLESFENTVDDSCMLAAMHAQLTEGETSRGGSILEMIKSSLVPNYKASQSGSKTDEERGRTLYETHCSSCHGSLASSTKAGADVVKITTAINNNYGGMSKFKTLLTEAELKLIAEALKP